MSGSSPVAAGPAHLQPAFLGLVMLGGTLGTAAREGLVLAVPSFGSVPLAVFLINVAGAFALGALLEGVVDRQAGTNRARSLRLFAGTGFLGGFTTYSALATGTDLLIRSGDVATGIVYATGTLVLGLAAAGAGVGLAARLRRRTETAGA